MLVLARLRHVDPRAAHVSAQLEHGGGEPLWVLAEVARSAEARGTGANHAHAQEHFESIHKCGRLVVAVRSKER